jgi:methionine synthase II (cobalamin-independent)
LPSAFRRAYAPASCGESPEFLDEAQDDATLLAIRDQERAGLDIITDGEQRRELFKPVRDGARGRRHRQSGNRA